jgi:hypothetical protein
MSAFAICDLKAFLGIGNAKPYRLLAMVGIRNTFVSRAISMEPNTIKQCSAKRVPNSIEDSRTKKVGPPSLTSRDDEICTNLNGCTTS